MESFNNLSGQYNDLKKDADTKDMDNARLKKKVEDLEALVSARDKELADARYRADYYEDKSTSMKLFTTVKVRVEMTKEYSEGKAVNWDLAAASSAWDKMKLLYSDLEGEDDQGAEDTGPSQISPYGMQAGVAELRDGSGVVVEDVVE